MLFPELLCSTLQKTPHTVPPTPQKKKIKTNEPQPRKQRQGKKITSMFHVP